MFWLITVVSDGFCLIRNFTAFLKGIVTYFQSDETGPRSCVESQLHCDGDKCVNPWQMCDGTVQCDSGVDEAKGFCTK